MDFTAIIAALGEIFHAFNLVQAEKNTVPFQERAAADVRAKMFDQINREVANHDLAALQKDCAE